MINTQVRLDFLSLVLIKKEKFKKFNGFFKRILYKLSYCSWIVIINKRLGGSNDLLTFHSSGDWKTKKKVLAGWVSFPGLQVMCYFCLPSHGTRP